MRPVVTIGLDIAKSGSKSTASILKALSSIRQKLTRGRLLKFFGKLDPFLVGIEA